MENLTSIFKALSDQNRLRVIAALQVSKELCACQIIELLNVSGATTSKHLGILIQSGLVNSKKEGRWVYYSLNKSSHAYKALEALLKANFKESQIAKIDKKKLKKIESADLEELCRIQRGNKCCP